MAVPPFVVLLALLLNGASSVRPSEEDDSSSMALVSQDLGDTGLTTSDTEQEMVCGSLFHCSNDCPQKQKAKKVMPVCYPKKKMVNSSELDLSEKFEHWKKTKSISWKGHWEFEKCTKQCKYDVGVGQCYCPNSHESCTSIQNQGRNPGDVGGKETRDSLGLEVVGFAGQVRLWYIRVDPTTGTWGYFDFKSNQWKDVQNSYMSMKDFQQVEGVGCDNANITQYRDKNRGYPWQFPLKNWTYHPPTE
jgi:hypothetical protein